MQSDEAGRARDTTDRRPGQQLGGEAPRGGVGGADLTTGIGHLPIFVEVGEEQAVDEGGFPEA